MCISDSTVLFLLGCRPTLKGMDELFCELTCLEGKKISSMGGGQQRNHCTAKKWETFGMWACHCKQDYWVCFPACLSSKCIGRSKKFKRFQCFVDSGSARLGQHCNQQGTCSMMWAETQKREVIWRSSVQGLYSLYGYHFGFYQLLENLHINFLTAQSDGLAAFNSMLKKVSTFISPSTIISPLPSVFQEEAARHDQ